MRVVLVCYLLLLVTYSQAQDHPPLRSHNYDGVLCEAYNQTVTSDSGILEADDWTFTNNNTLCENNHSVSKVC